MAAISGTTTPTLLPLGSDETVGRTGFTHKLTVNYTDLTGGTSSGTATTYDVFTVSQYDLLADVTFKVVTAFTGGSLSAATVTAGDQTTANLFATTGNSIFTAVSSYGQGAQNGGYFFTSSSTTFRLTFTPTSDSWSNATAGQVVIYFRFLPYAVAGYIL